MADIFRDIPDLTAVRNAVAASPKAVSVTLMNMPGESPDGTFTATLESGAVIAVSMTIVTPRPEPEGTDMFVLTFPSVGEGGTAIRAQDRIAGIDVQVGYCERIGLRWHATLTQADHLTMKVDELDRPALTELKNVINGRLERNGPWWR